MLEEGEGARGMLTAEVLAPLLPLALAEIDRALICGPEAMQAAVRDTLAARGLAADRIMTEVFTSPRAARSDWQAQTATLLADGVTPRRLAVAPGQSLLDAALDAGESLPFSCLSGGCGACVVQVLDGRDNLALDTPNPVSREAIGAGRVPACITRLTGPVTFRRAEA